MKKKLYEIVYNEAEGFHAGITAIGVVSDPAIRANFVAFAANQANQANNELVLFKTADTPKQMLIGAVMIPNLPIYRADEDRGEFYTYASADTISKLAHDFLKYGRQSQATIEHESQVEGFTVVESWIVKDSQKDKQQAYGLNHPAGTWMVTMKITSTEIWADWIESAKLTGFSIEGMLGYKLVDSPEDETEVDEKAMKRIRAAIATFQKVVVSQSKNQKNVRK
jgi:hypothetical protein